MPWTHKDKIVRCQSETRNRDIVINLERQNPYFCSKCDRECVFVLDQKTGQIIHLYDFNKSGIKTPEEYVDLLLNATMMRQLLHDIFDYFRESGDYDFSNLSISETAEVKMKAEKVVWNRIATILDRTGGIKDA